jgi:hypothetical protein
MLMLRLGCAQDDDDSQGFRAYGNHLCKHELRLLPEPLDEDAARENRMSGISQLPPPFS